MIIVGVIFEGGFWSLGKSEKYFLFDPNALITVEGYTLAPELTEIKKYYGYWKDSDEQMICEFLENLNRPFVQKRQAEEERLAKRIAEYTFPVTVSYKWKN